jgi:hypothetical protein
MTIRVTLWDASETSFVPTPKWWTNFCRYPDGGTITALASHSVLYVNDRTGIHLDFANEEAYSMFVLRFS